MRRVLQDIKTHQPQRPPAPAALKWAYLGTLGIVLSMGAWVGYGALEFRSNLEAIKHERAEYDQATEDIQRFSGLFASLESTKRLDLSRKEWQETRVEAAQLELAVLRAVQDAQIDLRAKKEDQAVVSSVVPQMQVKSLQVAWTPRAPGNVVPVAHIDITVIANVPKQGAQIALNKALSRWAEKVGFVVNSPRWGDSAGGVLTLGVEFRPRGAS